MSATIAALALSGTVTPVPTRRTTRRTASSAAATAPRPLDQRIIDVSVVEEMETSFLAYALSVITARALPDARDGLKPVQRRILFSLWSQHIHPTGPYKKSARVVGDTMARYHPHGDSSIYLSLCNLATGFSMRLPLVDPHGNFGSLDDSPAASRYTECRLAISGMEMISSIDEDTVDFAANYDGTEREPVVLPAAFPNLLVNGSIGVAVGMTTSIPPHNLAEVAAAAKALLENRRMNIDELLQIVPGPDFPAGGEIVDRSEVIEAYKTGKGAFKVRARARVVDLENRRRGIEVTELPYMVGPEKVIARVRQLLAEKKLDGIASAVDLTDRSSKLRLVFEVKSGFDPNAVLAELYRSTPMEETFPVSLVALVGGRPKVCTLLDLLSVYLDHRLDVVRRRTEHRLARATARLHLVDGLLVALSRIDEVIAIIRSSTDTATARQRLTATLALSDDQTAHILEMPLRRLTSLEVQRLEDEARTLRATITSLNAILRSPKKLAALVATELDATVAAFATERRTALSVSHTVQPSPAGGLELADTETLVGLTPTGEVAQVVDPLGRSRPNKNDRFVQLIATSTRAQLLVLTADGVCHPLAVEELPVAAKGSPGRPVGDYIDADTHPVALLVPDTTVAVATRAGVVKRTVAEARRSPSSIIRLDDGDMVVGAGPAGDDADLVFVTRNGQVLRTEASNVRPQGRTAGGMAGIRLSDDEVVAFAVVDRSTSADVVVVTDAGGVKVTAVDEFPHKGRATAGVRVVRFRSDEAALVAASVGADLAGFDGRSTFVPLPERTRRDAAATRADTVVSEIVTVRPAG
jgi:DNA gyrase subunit A